MNTVSGWTRRTLLKTPRKATERFRLTVDGGVDRRLDDGEFVVDEYRFDDQPRDVPVVVYSRRLDLDQAAVLSARLQPLMVHVPQAVEPAVHVDATGHDRLSDDEFWSIIGELGGKAWEGRLANAERALAKHDEDFVLRFAQTMAWKAHLLDHPYNFRIDHVDDGVNVVLQGDYRWLFGSVIAGGKSRWEGVMSNPGSRDPKWGSDLSFSVMHLADRALTRQRGVRQVIVTTSWPLTIGSNLENWAGSGYEVRNRPPTSPPTAEEQAAHAAVVKSAVDGIRTDWYSVRYFIAFDDHALEQIALHVGLANSGPSLDHEVATRLARAAGGILLGSARGAQLVMPVVRSTTLSVSEMRTTIVADDYIRRFIDGRP